MTDTNDQKETPMWREALSSLRDLLKAEWQAAAILAVLLICAHLVNLYPDDLAVMQQDPKNWYISHPKIVMHLMLETGLFLLPCIPAYYVFTTLHFQHTAMQDPPRVTLRGFLHWFGKCLQKYLLLSLLLLVAGVSLASGAAVQALIGSMAKSAETEVPLMPYLMPACSFIAGLTFLFYYYCVFRLSLVTPMAILKQPAPIKDSWRLTKGKCWRLFCNGFILFAVLFCVFLVPFMVQGLVAKQMGQGSAMATALSAFVSGAWGAVMVIGFSIYYCITYRVLLLEQRQDAVLVQI